MDVLDRELRRLLQQLTLGSIVKPTNILEERENFLNPRHLHRRKSPMFRYKQFSSTWTDLKLTLPLTSMDAPEEVIDIYREKQRELSRTKKMFDAIGSDNFTRFSIDIFGAPTAEDAHEAHDVLKKLSDVATPERNCSAVEFAKLLEERIQKLGISIDVKLDPSMTTKVWVDGVSRGIHLNQSALFAPQEINRLLVHEVDVHAVRIHNGSCFPWGIFAMGTAGYREAEEGLAVHYEREMDCLYPFQEKIYAGRCLAVYLSLSSGFADVFAELLTYFDDKTVYSIVERIKRGMTDTSRPGALTKDFHYFSGPKKIQSYLLGGGDLPMLMGGKIAFNHAPVIARLVQEKTVDISKWIFPVELNDDREFLPI
ncbi:MAG: DUF1704 domain-containing protein [Desulfobacterales bacterium]|nr:MAG: DUF1704 domain-containing protein [Desulfobacterales bacterium]